MLRIKNDLVELVKKDALMVLENEVNFFYRPLRKERKVNLVIAFYDKEVDVFANVCDIDGTEMYAYVGKVESGFGSYTLKPDVSMRKAFLFPATQVLGYVADNFVI